MKIYNVEWTESATKTFSVLVKAKDEEDAKTQAFNRNWVCDDDLHFEEEHIIEEKIDEVYNIKVELSTKHNK
jgi:hypothetical protein